MDVALRHEADAEAGGQGLVGLLRARDLGADARIAFIVALGVLLDTLVVRSLLVPAMMIDIGRRAWWPSVLARRED